MAEVIPFPARLPAHLRDVKAALAWSHLLDDAEFAFLREAERRPALPDGERNALLRLCGDLGKRRFREG